MGDSVKINAGPFDSQSGQTGRVEDARMQKCYWLEENPDYEEMTFFVISDWYFLDELMPTGEERI